VSPNDDDPLAGQEVVDQVRRERSSGPTHVDEGGSDASQFDVVEEIDYERPHLGPSHGEEGGGDVVKRKSRQQSVGYWMIRNPIPQVELPTERRKKELRKELVDTEQFLTLDYRFKDIVRIPRYMNPGYERYRVIEQFWKQVYEDYQPGDGDSLQLRGFTFNYYIHALDEFHELEAPHVELIHHLWGNSGIQEIAGVAKLQVQVHPHLSFPGWLPVQGQ
jgi:hypothetical protein